MNRHRWRTAIRLRWANNSGRSGAGSRISACSADAAAPIPGTPSGSGWHAGWDSKRRADERSAIRRPSTMALDRRIIPGFRRRHSPKTGCEAAQQFVGWAELGEAHHCDYSSRRYRWASLRSAHPTFAKRIIVERHPAPPAAPSSRRPSRKPRRP
jgi:hypothetical protein